METTKIKTPEEILQKDFNITENTMFHEYNYLYNSMLKALSLYGNNEYKRGVEDGKIITEHGTTMWQE